MNTIYWTKKKHTGEPQVVRTDVRLRVTCPECFDKIEVYIGDDILETYYSDFRGMNSLSIDTQFGPQIIERAIRMHYQNAHPLSRIPSIRRWDRYGDPISE